MEQIVKTNTDLTDDERILFAIAYKKIVEVHRKAWLTISEIEANTKLNLGDTIEFREICEYREKIEYELRNICNAFLVSSLCDESMDYLLYLRDCLINT